MVLVFGGLGYVNQKKSKKSKKNQKKILTKVVELDLKRPKPVLDINRYTGKVLNTLRPL